MKKQVELKLFEDMVKYVKGFKPCNYSDYEVTSDFTSPEVKEYLRNYYDEHKIRVDIQSWLKVHDYGSIEDFQDVIKQTIFVSQLFDFISHQDDCSSCKLSVIGTHYDNYRQDVALPIFELVIESYGLTLILCSTMYQTWTISVNSKNKLILDYPELFEKKATKLAPTGIPQDKIYGCYEENSSQFTTQIGSKYKLFTLVYLMKKCLEKAK